MIWFIFSYQYLNQNRAIAEAIDSLTIATKSIAITHQISLLDTYVTKCGSVVIQ